MGLRIGSQALALLLLVYSADTVAGLDWTQCLLDIKASANVTNNLVGLLDGNGYPVSNIADATAISYSLCTSACGSGRNFQWPVLSQDFSSWLLPYLALISQLPFGADDRLDSFMSAVLTVGSPALAGYSLFITLLNSRWINRRFGRLTRTPNPNSRSAISIVSSLQQFPLKWHSNDPASLIILSESDCWWKYLHQLTDNGQSWSAASATSIGWVVVAYVLSIANSPSDAFTSTQADGGATGSMWLWLISIVVGWLLLSPKCDFKRLTTAYEQADQYARTGSTYGPIGTRIQRALTITAQDDDVASSDELLTPPVFNYSRSLPWTYTAEKMFLAFQAAAQNQFPDINSEAQPASQLSGRWVPGVFTRMALASGASLALQWGTVGGAFITEWFTPTTGMGCRSLSYLIYGAVSTVIWMMLLISSILAHYSGPAGYSDQKPVFSVVPRALSVCLRRMGKLLAIANSVWVILTCVLQYSDFYDTCFCNSSMISRGQAAYITIIETSAQAFLAKVAWYGALSLSLGSAGAFIILISLLLDTLSVKPSPQLI